MNPTRVKWRAPNKGATSDQVGLMPVGVPKSLVASAEAWLKRRRRKDQSCEKNERRVRDAGVKRRGEERCAYIQHKGQVL